MCAAVPMLRYKDSLGRVEGAVCSETEEREDHSMCWKSLVICRQALRRRNLGERRWNILVALGTLIVLASGALMFSGLVLLVFDVPSMLMAVAWLMVVKVRASRLFRGRRHSRTTGFALDTSGGSSLGFLLPGLSSETLDRSPPPRVTVASSGSSTL